MFGGQCIEFIRKKVIEMILFMEKLEGFLFKLMQVFAV